MNTGILQATIAYKRALDGTPLDVNGRPTSETGRPQAIAVLEGTTNPNPLLYEIEAYFIEGGFIYGAATAKVDYETCPVSNFTTDMDFIILTPESPTANINVFSTYGWALQNDEVLEWVGMIPISGGSGVTSVTLSAVDEQYNQGYLILKENVTGAIKQVYVIHTDALGWILETGFWNDLRFWEDNEFWNY